MTDLASWPRPHFQPGGGQAVLLYAVLGDLPADPPPMSRKRYRSLGPGEGFDLRRFERARHADWFAGLEAGALGRAFQGDDPATFARIARAPACVFVDVRRDDPRTLDYLRDAVGFVTFLLDHGAVGALDVTTLRTYSPARWREELFDPAGPVPRHHVAILQSDDWLHTRGLRKFGRPDLSVRDVPPEHEDAIVDLLERFTEMQAFGALIPEGQEVRMRTLPPGLTCHHTGDLDDPDFNNVHLEIRWP